MSDTVTSKPDVHDMVVVHRTFRQACAELPDLVCGLRPGDTARAALVVDAVRFMLSGLGSPPRQARTSTSGPCSRHDRSAGRSGRPHGGTAPPPRRTGHGGERRAGRTGRRPGRPSPTGSRTDSPNWARC
ncbi:hypothetical protein ACRAWF_37590 [Streptomyces sp. L7]